MGPYRSGMGVPSDFRNGSDCGLLGKGRAMKTQLIAASVLSLLILVAPRSVASETPTYLPGFIWDWRVDFGEPSEASELPPNPNGDSLSRSQTQNAGLSDGPQVDNVWQYGNAPYAGLLDATFSSADFAVFTQAGSRNLGGFTECFWSDSLTISGNYDQVAFSQQPVHNGHIVHPDSKSGQEAAIIRWTYPGETSVRLEITGLVDHFGEIAGGNDGVDFYLLRNSSADTIDYAVVSTGGSYTVDTTTYVQEGDELFIAIGYLSNDGSDSTFVDLTFQVGPTLMGDVDLSGYVDDDDLSILLANWNLYADWTTGDLDQNGFVADNDLSLILASWNDGTPPLDGSAVPEPTTLVLLAVGGLALIRCKRRSYLD